MKLGKLLIEHKLISVKQLNKALENQDIHAGKLGTNLVELGFITDQELAAFLAHQFQLPSIANTALKDIPDEVIAFIPRDMARKHQIIPYKLDHRLHVAQSDPSDLKLIDELQHKLGKVVKRSVAPEAWIFAALEQYYGITREIRRIALSDEDNDTTYEVISDISQNVVKPNYLEEEEEDEEEGKEAEEQSASDEEDPTPLPFPRYFSKLIECDNPSEIAKLLFSFLTQFYPQMAFFRVNQQKLRGWILSGIPIQNREFQQMEAPFPLDPQNLPTGSTGNFTVQPSDIFDAEALQKLHLTKDSEAQLHPISFQNTTPLCLLTIPGSKNDLDDQDRKTIAQAIQKAALRIEILYLKKVFLKPIA